jgi:hypothetical protein
VAGTIVAAKVRRLAVIHGLCTACVAAFVMTVGILGLNLAFGGTIDPGFFWLATSFTVNVGALLTLPAAAIAATIAASRRGAAVALG